jgi:hypothetical protein
MTSNPHGFSLRSARVMLASLNVSPPVFTTWKRTGRPVRIDRSATYPVQNGQSAFFPASRRGTIRKAASVRPPNVKRFFPPATEPIR